MPEPFTHPIIADLKAHMKRGKVVSAEEAVRVIRDGDHVATDGFVGTGFAEEIAIELEELLPEDGQPEESDPALRGRPGGRQGRGSEPSGPRRAGQAGHRRALGPGAQTAEAGLRRTRSEAYNLPQGVISHMFRDIAAHKPRTITRVGLGTFVDPRSGGGKINASTTRGARRAHHASTARNTCPTRPFPINVAFSAARRPTRTATSRWRGRP